MNYISRIRALILDHISMALLPGLFILSNLLFTVCKKAWTQNFLKLRIPNLERKLERNYKIILIS